MNVSDKSEPLNPAPLASEVDDDHDGFTFEIVEDEHTHEGKRVRSRGVYLIPNLITTAALLSGFYSIIASTSAQFEKAILAIFLAALLDGLDGRAARLLKAQSPFGEQFDSLSDMLSFGVAPAILVYAWILAPLGRLGLGCAFIYTACAAFRLARFNVQIGVVDKKYFIGLASPLAAILLSSTVWVSVDNPTWFGAHSSVAMTLYASVSVICGLLMISNVKYFSFKEFDRQRVPFFVMIPIVLILLMITYNVPIGILTIGGLYALSGFWSTWQERRKRLAVNRK